MCAASAESPLYLFNHKSNYTKSICLQLNDVNEFLRIINVNMRLV